MFRAITRSLFILCALLACLEIGLRWGVGLGQPPLAMLDPDVEYRLIPQQSYRRFGNTITINRYGMRAPDFAPVAQPDERRILLVGDSVVYGNHQIDQAQTIASVMMAAANKDTPLGTCQTRVMPAATSSWGPVNQAAYVSQTGLLDADVVMIVLSAHDLYDTPTHIPALIPYRLHAPWGAVGDAIQILINGLRAKPQAPPGRAPRQERLHQSLSALHQLHAMARDADIPLVLVYHPTLPERANGTGTEPAILRRWTRRTGTTFADLGTLPLDPALYDDDIHPAAGGAAAVAQFLFSTARPLLQPCPEIG